MPASTAAASPITVRVHRGDLAEIDRRAEARGLSRSAFMIAASLGRTEVQTDAEQLRAEFERVDDRLERIEAALWPS